MTQMGHPLAPAESAKVGRQWRVMKFQLGPLQRTVRRLSDLVADPALWPA